MKVNNTTLIFLVELGVMIKKTGYRIPQHEALSYVGGYFLCLDLTTQMLAQRNYW